MVSLFAFDAPPKPVGRTERRFGFRVTMPIVSSAPKFSEKASKVPLKLSGLYPREPGTALTCITERCHVCRRPKVLGVQCRHCSVLHAILPHGSYSY